MASRAADGPQVARSPSLGDFSFVGFDGADGAPPEVGRALRRVEIRGGEPRLSVVENAVYVPARLAGHPRRRRAELVPGLEAGVAASHVRDSDEEVVYLGWRVNHYGHFLMQSLARVWALPAVDPSVRVVFHQPAIAGWQPAGWAVRMLEAFGVPRDRVLVPEEPTRFRRVLVPEPLFEPRSVAEDRTVRVHEAMAQPYRAVAARIVGAARPSPQPVYLSRRQLPSSQRLLVGEDGLEGVLRRNGFRIAHPQTMTFEEQVRLVNAHADIVSNAGSAAQNVLFALHAPRLHLQTGGSRFSPDYFMHAAIVWSPTTFINCLGTGGRPVFPGAHKLTPLLVDVPALSGYLHRQGLLAEPPSPPPGRPRRRAARRIRRGLAVRLHPFGNRPRRAAAGRGRGRGPTHRDGLVAGQPGPGAPRPALGCRAGEGPGGAVRAARGGGARRGPHRPLPGGRGGPRAARRQAVRPGDGLVGGPRRPRPVPPRTIAGSRNGEPGPGDWWRPARPLRS
jgi:hypothetical protein